MSAPGSSGGWTLASLALRGRGRTAAGQHEARPGEQPARPEPVCQRGVPFPPRTSDPTDPLRFSGDTSAAVNSDALLGGSGGTVTASLKTARVTPGPMTTAENSNS